ncbi:hypothetical protein [Arthrobacter sp. OY3WO11]|uniref:hypothetical protein n=1 Tax=Arthrobacter sp. OY3WO11 TaxID=1835723 RepID=UPI000A6437E8|nr:hypothetical protein [Arthrobacter sp. OY3WO11]
MNATETEEVSQDPSVRGANMVDLVIGSPEWVHRRVDTLTLGTDGDTQRSISLDITLPQSLKVEASGKRVLLPLAFIRKGALRRVSTAGPSKHPFPILEKARNSEIAREMLLTMIPEDWVSGQESKVAAAVGLIVRHDGVESGNPAKQLKRLLTSITKSREEDAEQVQTISDLARTLQTHFLLIGELDEMHLDTRCIIKISYEHELEFDDGWDYSTVFRYDLPDYGFAASEHVEVVVPSELTLRIVSLSETGGDGSSPTNEDIPTTERARGHVALPPTDRFTEASVVVEVAPSKRGIFPFAAISVAVCTAVAGLALMERFEVLTIVDRSRDIPTTAVSLLLAGPALFLSWIARTPEHEIVAKLLSPLRLCLLMCAAVFLGLGVVAAFPLTREAWDVVWLLIYGGAFVSLGWFVAFRLALRRRLTKALDLLVRSRKKSEGGMRR